MTNQNKQSPVGEAIASLFFILMAFGIPAMLLISLIAGAVKSFKYLFN